MTGCWRREDQRRDLKKRFQRTPQAGLFVALSFPQVGCHWTQYRRIWSLREKKIPTTQQWFFFQRTTVLSPFIYVNIHLHINYLLAGEKMLKCGIYFSDETTCYKQTRSDQPLPTNASILISPSVLGWCWGSSSWFTYQLCNSAKAALIFFTELSTSSLIIIRYLLRETVQRCRSFTDFSMFGPKTEKKIRNYTLVKAGFGFSEWSSRNSPICHLARLG